uniref:Uncharacterized protein n=1 Tax=Phaeocystis antarctica TaxID=33657 RepID=A0A7S0I159_9EUKA|mmetsp:Transcript_75272/g.181924  ORF Transcript_75272/g.181924 Transcript_75272/m.181924 type:complete len:231 (+) Transcript_75272:76-768(+)
MAPSEEALYRAPGPDGPAGSSSGPNGSLDALGENALKIILLGDSACGKSKLVERFLLNNYQSRQLSTYALTLFRHNATVDGQKVEIDFWDTAGQERFNSMHPAYYHLAHACILCFDVTRKQTYKNLPDWYRELREFRQGIPVVCIGNKIDVDPKVTQKEFGFPKKHNLEFFYCSASDGTNVVAAFEAAISKAIEYSKKPPEDFVDQVMQLLDDGKPENRWTGAEGERLAS